MTEDLETLRLRAQARQRQALAKAHPVGISQEGASGPARLLVGGIDKPEDRLATLKQFYPDAQPDPLDKNNFIFTDPKTGEMTSYNPRGLDVGDIASVTREASQVAGGAAGALAGTPGGLPGAAAGSILGTGAGEEAFNFLARQFGMQDTRSLGERAGDTAITSAAGIAGPVGGAVGGAGLRGGIKAAFRGGKEGRQEAAEAVADMERFDTHPSLAHATQSPVFDTLETFISRTPGAAGYMRKMAQEARDKIGRGMDERAFNLTGRSNLEPEIAGRTIEQGIRGFTRDFMTRSGAMYNQLDKHLPASTVVPISNAKTAIAALADKTPYEGFNKLVSSPTIRGIAGDIPDQITYAELKQIRSAIGRKLGTPSLVDDVPRADLKEIYGALSEDMRAAAAAAGPDAERAFVRANTFYKAGLSRIEDSLEPLIKNKMPEQVFLALERGGKQGPTKIRTLMRSLKQDERNLVAAAVMKRIGKAKASVQDAEGAEFSLDTFLTNWNNLDPAAKDAIFSTPDMKGMKADLEAIARSAARMRESSRAFFNPPGSGPAGVAQGAFLLGMGSGAYGIATGASEALAIPAMLAMTAGGANLTARLITSRPFVRWLASSTKVKPNGWAAQIGRLAGIAAVADPAVKDDIRDFLGILTAASSTPPTSGPAKTPGPRSVRPGLSGSP